MSAVVAAVHLSADHTFSKGPVDRIELIAGHGVAGDTHAGTRVQHRSRVAIDPTRPNLRQVHLIGTELIDELRRGGFDVAPGQMGENITTRNIDLLGLPTGTILTIGGSTIEVTGLRNPCHQLDTFRPGLMGAVLRRDQHGDPVLRTVDSSRSKNWTGVKTERADGPEGPTALSQPRLPDRRSRQASRVRKTQTTRTF